jgi:outer membrane protein, multidrug efflux system
VRTGAALIPALLALAACATVPPAPAPKMPVEAPSAWTANAVESGTGGRRHDWWRDFGDARLSALVEEALRRNPRLDEAAARVRQACALAGVAEAGLVPHIDVGVEGARARRFVGDIPRQDNTSRSDLFGASLNVSWELDVWGRIEAGHQASLKDVDTQRALYHGASLSLAGQTSKAYLTAVESRMQVVVAEAALTSAEDLAGRVRERFAQGLRRALDVKLAESEVASARSSLHQRRRVHDLSVRQLEILAGRYPASSALTSSVLPALPGPVPAGVPADVLARRPDLVAAERRLAANWARVHEADAGLYPRIALTASKGLASDDLDDLLGGHFGVWSLVGNLTAPLFSGGRLRANAKLMKARHEESIAGFASAVLAAFGEVEGALAREGYLRDQGAALDDLVRDARASVDLSQARYHAGLSDILGVLEARRRHFDARSALLLIQRERLVARVDLHVALGGGFEKDRIVRPTKVKES